MQKIKCLCPEDLFAQAMQQDRSSLSDKDMCLLVSGLAALHSARSKPLNSIEMMAVDAMIAYTAYHNQVEETKVRTLLSDQFSTGDISKLPSHQYANIIAYLTDLEIPRVLN